MERDQNERRERDERIKTARELLEERLAKMGPIESTAEAPPAKSGEGGAAGKAGTARSAAGALREAAERAPADGGAFAQEAAPGPADLEELRKKAAERDEYWDQLLRARAELDNYQKRTRREMAEYKDFALAGVLGDVLLAIDTLDMTLQAAGGARDLDALAKGVELARAQLEKILADRGTTRVRSEGVFDPRVHEVVLTEPRKDVPPGTITGEIRRGYTYKDRLIRPAQVKVAAAPPSEEPPAGEGGTAT